MEKLEKSDFESLSPQEISFFIDEHKANLEGGSVFTKNKSATSKLICFVSKGREPETSFIPSHVGSIIKINRQLYIFDMKPPIGKITLLSKYISETDDEFEIIISDFVLNGKRFKLDKKRFSEFVKKRIGQKYGWFSSVKSCCRVLNLLNRQTAPDEERKDQAEHCNEIHLKALQDQGLFLDYNANDMMPNDLKNLLEKDFDIKDAGVKV